MRRMKQLMALFLSLVMVIGMLPTPALAAMAAAGVSPTLVSSLAKAYGGDETRAREELEALYDAGIIDGDGNLVSLDVRENGEGVELGALAQRIAGGEEVGAITVNGHDATTEQIA